MEENDQKINSSLSFNIIGYLGYIHITVYKNCNRKNKKTCHQNNNNFNLQCLI